VSNSLRLRRFRTAYPTNAKAAAAQPSSTTSTATVPALPDAQLAQLAAIASRLESVAEALTQQEPARFDVSGNGDRAQQIGQLQQLRAEIDTQLRDLQRP
jgi:hypothetical protein